MQKSQLGMVAMILGILSIVLSCMGMAFPIGAIMAIVAIVLAKKELSGIASGEIDPESAGMAKIGFGSAIGGCAVQLLMVLLLVLYFVFVFGVVILGNM